MAVCLKHKIERLLTTGKLLSTWEYQFKVSFISKMLNKILELDLYQSQCQIYAILGLWQPSWISGY